MKIMKPTCWVQKYWLRGKINHVEVEQKCEDCIFMDRCGPGFKCNMHCSENTILVDGKVGTKTCLELENDKLKTAECTDIFEEESAKAARTKFLSSRAVTDRSNSLQVECALQGDRHQ
jgi:hypothetical protein